MARYQYIMDIFFDLLNSCYERGDYRLVAAFVKNMEQQADVHQIQVPINKMKKEIIKHRQDQLFQLHM